MKNFNCIKSKSNNFTENCLALEYLIIFFSNQINDYH